MKNKMLLTMGLVAALMAAGCASTAGSASQPEAAPTAETVQAQQDAAAEDGKEISVFIDVFHFDSFGCGLDFVYPVRIMLIVREIDVNGQISERHKRD